MEQLKDNMRALEINIPPKEMERLGRVSDIELGFPHDFVLRSGAKKMIYGDMVDKIRGNKTPWLR